MFYSDKERAIFTPEEGAKQYDPLAILRRLTAASQGKFSELWNQWCAVNSDSGDVSIPAAVKEYESALAEEELVKAARLAFELPDFPECLDAVALSYLRTLMEFLEGKGERAGMPQDVQESSPVV